MLYAYWNLIQISNETGQTGQVRDGYAFILLDISLFNVSLLSSDMEVYDLDLNVYFTC